MKFIRSIINFLLIYILIVGAALPFYAADNTEQHEKVLYISSYGYDWASVPYQIKGVTSILSEETDIEYIFMNTKKMSYDLVKQDVHENIKKLYATNGTFDLIIVEDDAALDFALEYRNDLFRDIPIVFMGINTPEKADLAHTDPLITGMIECFPYHETIDLAYKMFPNATKIVGISDATDSGQGCSKRFFDEETYFPQLKFSEINTSELSKEEIAKKISELDKSTILVFLAFVNDADGNLYSLDSATDFVNENANIPMFKADMIGIGMGVLGGYVSSYEEMGKAAAEQAKRILSGTSPSDIPVDTMGGYPLFDNNIMEKYHISNKMLPKDSVVLNRDVSFFELYWSQLLILAFVILAIILILMSCVAISRKKLNNKLKTAIIKAESATKEKTAFLARMSHDMRTPMNTIINLSHMVEEEISDRDAALRDLHYIQESNDFLLGLINDVLDMSRIESGKMELHPVRYSYQDFLGYMHSTFDPLAEKRKIDFTITPGSEFVDIMIDKVRFNQICFNLVSNAIKYTKEGGHVSFTMKHGKMVDGILPCEIVIADDGIGMSEDFQKHMFTPFEQEGRSYRTVEGAGLGLAIVKNILNAIGATITVNSKKNGGTTITIKMDMILADNSAPVEQPKKYDISVLSGKHVLLAEDHLMNQKIAIRLLTKVGMDVTVAENGKAAFDMFCSDDKHYDVILMDLRMPVMDGLSATAEIRKSGRPDAKTIPIIAMTANDYAEDIENCLSSGMNGHVAKPVDAALLYRTLAQLI